MDTEKTAQPFDPASFEHVPVLLNECLDGLKIDPAGTYLDGTAGGAGHSRQIALRLNGEQGGRLISLDQDPDAVQTARARLAGLPATVVQINFRYAGQALEQLGIETINGALLDLGVSSHQLDDAARGFSYRADAPLDMRMSQEGETAADLVNSESREELARILRDYGEEPFAWQIAGRIVEARETAAMQHALQLVGAALLVGFAVSLLWSEAQLVELNSQIQSAKAELVSEQSQYTYYNSALNSRTNITSVEETATRLGLMKIDQSQITYIRLDEGSVLVRKASAVRQWSDLLHDGAMTILASVRTAK